MPNRRSEQERSRLVKMALSRLKGDNKKVVEEILSNIKVGDSISIVLDSGGDVTGKVLNLFYPVNDFFAKNSRTFDPKKGHYVKTDTSRPEGIKVDEAQAEEVARYQDIASYKVV